MEARQPTAASTPPRSPRRAVLRHRLQDIPRAAGTYTKNSPERSVGKTCDLAFGYMGGLNAWRKFEPERFTDEEVEKFKTRVARCASEDQAILVRR